MTRSFSPVVLVLMLIASAVQAQSDLRLQERLDPETRAQVEAVIGASRAAGLPTEWLVDAALEAAAKGARGAQIVAFVSKRAGHMTVARDVLSPAIEAEIVSGAGVLQRGVRRETLAELRKRRPRADLTMSLGVLENLVSRGVPGDTAAAVMIALAGSGMRDTELELFKERVNRDIALGISPAAAASTRASVLAGDLGLSPGSNRGPTAGGPVIPPQRP